jgi:competence protein ComEA
VVKIGRDHVVGYVIMLVLGVGLGMGGLTLSNRARPAPIEIIAAPAPEPTATPGPLQIFVNGAVRAEAVYPLPPGSRVADAITAAGGFREDAYTAVVNLALPLQDGAQVYVPTLSDATAVAPVAGLDAPPGSRLSPVTVDLAGSANEAAADSGALVNINSATLAELDALPGIGPSTAQKIIDHRTANGPFASIEAIMEVAGIGEAKFAEIKDRITVGP